MKQRHIFFTLSILLLAGLANPSSAAKSEGGPSLASTLKFIADKLADRGAVNFILFYDNATDNTHGQTTNADELSAVQFDAGACTLTYHINTRRDAETQRDSDVSINFRSVKKITVRTAEAAATEWSAQAGQPNIISTSSSPPSFVVELGKDIGPIYFQDRDDADRTAKAMLHAVELCGGGNDPF